MFFSFPTSFLCFSWNSFAASSCGQSPGDRLGQRQAEKEAQKKGEGTEDLRNHIPLSGTALTKDTGI